MPIELTYDTLPPGSALLRQSHDDGSITITAPAGEPDRLIRRQIMFDSAARSILPCAALVVLALVSIHFSRRGAIDPNLIVILRIGLGLFCLALFAFVWRTIYQRRIEQIDHARQRITVMHISPMKILAEVSIVGGTAHSHSISPPIMARIARTKVGALPALEFNEAHQLFVGWSDLELHWIAHQIESVTRRPQT